MARWPALTMGCQHSTGRIETLTYRRDRK